MKKILCLSITLLALFSQSVHAVVYTLPATNSRLIGHNISLVVPEKNRLPLEAFAARYQMGLSNMLEANPHIDVYLPRAGANMIIPHQLILPDAPREGIVINSAEMRLYYYPPKSGTVIVFPIGIGELGKTTPIDWVTKVERKRANPTWTPTKAMHAEYAARGETLPAIFPAGPDNPMGLFALYIGRLYAIHGTNADFGIGLRVSHGCIRLRADDIEWLYKNVAVGTRVQFINQPVKATIEPDGSRYVEVHNPLSTTEEQFNSSAVVPISIPEVVSKIITDASVDQSSLNSALQQRSGMPVKINALVSDSASTPAPANDGAAQSVANEVQKSSADEISSTTTPEATPPAPITDLDSDDNASPAKE